MKCKNCELPLQNDYSFCSNCGAKIIRNRLTLKNLWFDITERYFNIDNTFFKTLWHLIIKPEVVIDGYISGVRKKYLNPISYLGIAITLSGFIVFLMKKKSHLINFDVFDMGVNTDYGQSIIDFTTDYQAILFIIYIPMMAAASWLAYEKKKYNFTERLLVFMYTLAQYSVFLFLPSILTLTFYPQSYVKISLPLILFMYIYSGYIIKRTSHMKGSDLIVRLFIFYALFTFQYFAMSVIIPIILLLNGTININDIIQKK